MQDNLPTEEETPTQHEDSDSADTAPRILYDNSAESEAASDQVTRYSTLIGPQFHSRQYWLLIGPGERVGAGGRAEGVGGAGHHPEGAAEVSVQL